MVLQRHAGRSAYVWWIQVRKSIGLRPDACISTLSMTFEINDRVRVGRHKATVRYVGPVNGQTGTWVGLEWDDASRGKHDGSVSGIQYFRCQHGQTAGSFVRAEKVQRGVGLLEALRLRYTNQQAEAAALEAAEAAAGVRSRVSFLFVGEDQVTERQSKLDQLVRARLVDAMVDHLVGACCRPCCCVMSGLLLPLQQPQPLSSHSPLYLPCQTI